MKQSIMRLTIIAFPMLLGGCVAVWGSAYKVESQNSDEFLIQYDTNFIDNSDIEKMANDHCHAFGKTALLQEHDKNIVNLTTDNFLCRAPAPVVAPDPVTTPNPVMTPYPVMNPNPVTTPNPVSAP